MALLALGLSQQHRVARISVCMLECLCFEESLPLSMQSNNLTVLRPMNGRDRLSHLLPPANLKLNDEPTSGGSTLPFKYCKTHKNTHDCHGQICLSGQLYCVHMHLSCSPQQALLRHMPSHSRAHMLHGCLERLWQLTNLCETYKNLSDACCRGSMP